MSKGMAAPTENVAADVSAACTGRAAGDFRDPKLIARVGGQRIFRHQLLSNLPRERLIEATLDVDFGELIKLTLRILAQLLTLAREIRLLGVGL